MTKFDGKEESLKSNVKEIPNSFLMNKKKESREKVNLIRSEEAFNRLISDFSVPDIENKPNTSVYGVSIPDYLVGRMRYSSSTNCYFWTDSDRNYHSENDNFPAVIGPSGKLEFYLNGKLHRESGPAVISIYEETGGGYWLYGYPVSYDEFNKFDPSTNTIKYTDSGGQLHREDGPAIISFDEDGIIREGHFKHGHRVFSVKIKSPVKKNYRERSYTLPKEDREKIVMTDQVKRKPKVVKVFKKGTEMSNGKYAQLTPDEVEELKTILRSHKDHIRKFETEIREAGSHILKMRGLTEEDLMPPKKVKDKEVAKSDTKKNIRSMPDLTGSRTSQVSNGFKFGFKKGVVNNSSKALSEKVVSYTPLKDKQMFEKFVQICFLVGTAEMVERMPEGVAEKLHITEDMRLNAGSLFRYTSGENLGRDIVDIMTYAIPLFAEVMKNVSAEELEDLKNDFEEEDLFGGEVVEESESDTLFSSTEEEIEEKEEVHEELGVSV